MSFFTNKSRTILINLVYRENKTIEDIELSLYTDNTSTSLDLEAIFPKKHEYFNLLSTSIYNSLNSISNIIETFNLLDR